MHQSRIALLSILSGWLGISCVSPPVQRLPAYEAALKSAPTTELRCYEERSLDKSKLPALVPYASVATSYTGDKGYETRSLVKEFNPSLHPDIILLYEGGQFYAGSVSTASAVPVGGGAMAFGVSTPTYANALTALFMRLAPVKLGLGWDETGMILSATDVARESGVFEGDRIISIDGAPVTVGARWLDSPHFPRMLELKPGGKIRVVWIRPGTGKMEGDLTLQDNPPLHIDMPGIDLTPPPRRR